MIRNQIAEWLEDHFGEHIAFHLLDRRVTIYGFNAMHVAINIHSRRYGWVCFHPPIYFWRKWWPWYFYLSPNGTPGAATYAIGPGVSDRQKCNAKIRRIVLGHNYCVHAYAYTDILNIDKMVEGWPGIAESI